jgi:IS5 family transposase
VVIRKLVTDTASTHYSQHFDAVLVSRNTSRDVYAHKGYPSSEREAKLNAAKYRNHNQQGALKHPLSECQERRNL